MFGVGERNGGRAPVRAAKSERPVARGRAFSARRTRGYGISLGEIYVMSVYCILGGISTSCAETNLVLHSKGTASRGSRYGTDSEQQLRLGLSGGPA